MQARYHTVSIQLEVDRVFLTPFHGSTLSDFRKRQNEFLTSEKNVGINFWSSKSQTGSKKCFFKFIKHVIHELAHITRYHGPYSETSEWTFDFRIFLLNGLFLNVFKSMCWTHESQLLNFATNEQPYDTS